MLLATRHLSTPSSISPASIHAPAITNIHLVSMGTPNEQGMSTMRKLEIGFGAPPYAYGGYESRVSIRSNGSVAGVGVRGLPSTAAERGAAQAVLDAIAASGLLTQPLPGNDWQRPAAGKSRLYLDRRSKMVEFDTANPPAALASVLDAIAAYRALTS